MSRRRTRYGVLAVDPFDISTRPTEAQKKWAEWFKDITADMDGGGTYHIRRIHYRTLGKPKPDGKPYENTVNDAALLGRASEYARYLGLVDFDRIEDHKNEGEVVAVVYGSDEVDIDTRAELVLPNIETIHGISEIISCGDCHIAYDTGIRRPFHLEVWVEKSTMDDILIPIAKEYRAGLEIASGHFSVTNVFDLYKRIQGLNKPVRLFYIHDHDPAGAKMPTAVARKIEWFIRNRNPDIDFKLFDLVLTPEQVTEYGLPRSPMDRKERYKANFEKKHGEGAVELDALEALHPGVLDAIVRDALQPYFDEDLEAEVEDLEESEEARFDELMDGARRYVTETFGAELSPMIERYNMLVEEANNVAFKMRRMVGVVNAGEFEPEYPKTSSLLVEDEPDPILDTTLSFEEQMEKYLRR